MQSKASVCFAHNHMSPAEFGLYSYLRGISKKFHFNYRFDDRKIGTRFSPQRGGSKDAVGRLRRSLEEKGWIEWLGAKTRKSNGQYNAREGHILSHAEYQEKFPGTCCACIGNDADPCIDPDACIETNVEPVANEAADLYQQSDIKGNTTQTEIKTNGNTASYRFPSLPASLSDSTVALAADSEARGSESIQGVSNTVLDAKGQVRAFGEKFTSGLELAQQPEAIKALGSLMEARVHVPQDVHDLPNFNRIAKLTSSQAEAVFRWAMEEPFWSSKFSGRSALRTLCKHLPTIAVQRNNSLKRSTTTVLKAASVIPSQTKGFNYVGEIQ